MVGKRKHAATLMEETAEEDGKGAGKDTCPPSKVPRKGRKLKPPVEVPEPAQLCFCERQPEVCIGTSGYSYKHWRKGPYYPAGLAGAREFSMFSTELNFLEINATFYGWFSEETYDSWRERAAAARLSFRYAVKASQFYTHRKPLNVDQAFTEHWARFWERCQRLGPHLGPVLFQFPPNFKTTSKRGQETISNIDKLRQLGQVLPRCGKFVFEFRDASWYCPEVYAVLKEHDWCLSIVEVHGGASAESEGSSGAGSGFSDIAKTSWAGTLRIGANPPVEEYPLETCSWGVYVRYHGSKGQYCGTYGPEVMARWAQQTALWVASGRTVYHAFNNDQVDEDHNTPSAILDCRHLAAALHKLGTFS